MLEMASNTKALLCMTMALVVPLVHLQTSENYISYLLTNYDRNQPPFTNKTNGNSFPISSNHALDVFLRYEMTDF